MRTYKTKEVKTEFEPREITFYGTSMKTVDMVNVYNYIKIYYRIVQMDRDKNLYIKDTYNKSNEYCDMLVKEDTQHIYNQEIKKVHEYLDRGLYCIDIEELFDIYFSTGKMLATTINELSQFNGITSDQLDYFSKELYKAIYTDVSYYYDEIKRHLNGRYGVHYGLGL